MTAIIDPNMSQLPPELLDQIELTPGAHASRADGLCAMAPDGAPWYVIVQ